MTMQVVLLSGLSGSGKSVALNVLEDSGYYCVDNLPVKLLPDTVQLLKSEGQQRVALSIDGTKRSGSQVCELPIPAGLFEREVLVNCGRSMLRRLQMGGQTLEGEVVADRLLLTY